MGTHLNQPRELLRTAEVLKLVTYSANHLRRLEAGGEFPKRIQLGKNRVAWFREEIEQWLEEKASKREPLSAVGPDKLQSCEQ